VAANSTVTHAHANKPPRLLTSSLNDYQKRTKPVLLEKNETAFSANNEQRISYTCLNPAVESINSSLHAGLMPALNLATS